MKHPAAAAASSATLFTWAAVAGAAPTHLGMSYTPWNESEATAGYVAQSFDELEQLNGNWVALNVFWFQDGQDASGPMYPDLNRYSISDHAVRSTIRDLHDRGFNVLLKPNLDSVDGSWRGQFTPADPDAWFGHYGDFINHFADIAAQEGVAALSVGTEMNTLQARTADWQDVIEGARTRFGGELTYAANHDAYESVGFWGDLDFIGIDAYFPVADDADATLAEMTAAWDGIASQIGGWHAGLGVDARPIVFTEMGYRSLDGAAMRPWDFTATGAVDLQEQADAYAAMLAAVGDEPWFDGLHPWSWLAQPWQGGPNDTGFTVHGKPAEQVLANYYASIPEPGTATIAAGALLAGLGRRRR